MLQRRPERGVHVLDHPELRECFSLYDDPANRAKRWGRRLGVAAILLVFGALLLASVEHLLPHGSSSPSFWMRLREWPTITAMASAVLGIAGALVGSIGLLLAKRKRHWLRQRLMTERLRQFHFQELIFKLPEILTSMRNKQARDRYVQNRKAWFGTFIGAIEDKLDAEFTRITDEEGHSDVWLHEASSEDVGEVSELRPVFAAYRELRIQHQLGYANYKLSNDHRILSGSVRRQAAVLSTVGLFCIALLVLAHVAVLAIVLFVPGGWPAAHSVLAIGALWIALSALALRALEEGLQPEREIERYQHYRSAVRAVLERFDNARSQAEKLLIMREMEQVAFDELRNFLITNDRSRFVM